MERGEKIQTKLLVIAGMATVVGIGYVSNFFFRRRSAVAIATSDTARKISSSATQHAPKGTPFVRPPRKSTPTPPRDDVYEGLNDIEAALPATIQSCHDEACSNNQSTYTDPSTGLMVFTKVNHIQRGKCCGSRCRHCPYSHVNVPAANRPKNSNLKLKGDTQGSTVSAPQEAKLTTNVCEPVTGVHKASVYTKTGDAGTSSLFTGARASKGDFVFEALGAVDELNSFMGLAKEATKAQLALTAAGEQELGWKIVKSFELIQQRLLDVGSIVATPDPKASVLRSYDPPTWTLEVEELIDSVDKTLPQLDGFIIPGGSVAAGHIHVCRSVCRRAERAMVRLSEASKAEADAAKKQGNEAPAASYGIHLRASLKFINRLSDYFFVAARYVSIEADCHREK